MEGPVFPFHLVINKTKGETQMKKFLAMMLVVLVLASTACASNTSNDSNNIDISKNAASLVEVETSVLPQLPKEFIKTALQFIEEYPIENDNQLNRSIHLIHLSNNFRKEMFNYINSTLLPDLKPFIGYGEDRIKSVNCWIHNYEHGGEAGCVSLNGQDAIGNLSHNPLLLSASVLTPEYPDNLSLAEARICAYVLLQMDVDDVAEHCIEKSANGEYYYNITLKNESFKGVSKEILQSLLE